MNPAADLVIPYARLVHDGAGAASLDDVSDLDHEAASALLARTVRRSAEAAAGARRVEPVSVVVDVTGDLDAATRVDFVARIDRQTRTIIFASGDARSADGPILTATAVFRIV